jgi:hypothetical protein
MIAALTNEERVPLTKLAAELGVNRKTVARWADEGYEGEQLENYRIGRKRYSTREAADRFLEALNGKAVSLLGAQETPRGEKAEDTMCG